MIRILVVDDDAAQAEHAGVEGQVEAAADHVVGEAVAADLHGKAAADVNRAVARCQAQRAGGLCGNRGTGQGEGAGQILEGVHGEFLMKG